jgi:hypothetical protein
MASFMQTAKKYANSADIPKMNRYTASGYVAMKVLAEGMKQCGRNLTRACTIAKLEELKGFKTDIMPPISFSSKLYAFFNYPLLTIGVIVKIHFQAIKLLLKGAKFYKKPATTTT